MLALNVFPILGLIMIFKRALLASLLALVSNASMAQAPSEKIAVWLTEQNHGAGNGFPNTPNGDYSCGFDKAVYQLNEAGLITVRLVGDVATKQRFEIVSLQIDNDAKGEYTQASKSADSISFYGANRTAQSIYFTVYVRDLSNGAVIGCDPVVVNEPK